MASSSEGLRARRDRDRKRVRAADAPDPRWKRARSRCAAAWPTQESSAAGRGRLVGHAEAKAIEAACAWPAAMVSSSAHDMASAWTNAARSICPAPSQPTAERRAVVKASVSARTAADAGERSILGIRRRARTRSRACAPCPGRHGPRLRHRWPWSRTGRHRCPRPPTHRAVGVLKARRGESAFPHHFNRSKTRAHRCEARGLLRPAPSEQGAHRKSVQKL